MYVYVLACTWIGVNAFGGLRYHLLLCSWRHHPYDMASLASQLALGSPVFVLWDWDHLASIYVGSRDQTQVLTLSGQIFSPWAASQAPMSSSYGAAVFSSAIMDATMHSECVYQHSDRREPCWIWRQMGWYWGKPWEKRIQYRVLFKFNYCLVPGWVELRKTSSGPIHSHQPHSDMQQMTM